MGHGLSTFDIDARLRSIAEHQLGLVTVDQALGAGIEASAIKRRRAAGGLVPVFRGVMRIASVTPTVQQRILAASLTVQGSIVVGPSAALIHGLPVRVPERPDDHQPVLAVEPDRVVRRPEIRTLRTTERPRSVRWFTARLASPAATIVGLPRFVDDATVERCLDAALVHRLTTVAAIQRLLDATPPAGFVGRSLLMELMAARSGGLGHRSRLEQRVGTWLNAGGLHGWRANYRARVRSGKTIEVDFAWTEQRVALEVSPFFTHGSRQTQERDLQRRRLLVAAGWRVVEASDSDVNNPTAFAPTIAMLRPLLERPARDTARFWSLNAPKRTLSA